jgi:hypothetical protein
VCDSVVWTTTTMTTQPLSARVQIVVLLAFLFPASGAPTLGPGGLVVATGRAHPSTWTPLPLGQCSGLALARSYGTSASPTACGMQNGAPVLPAVLNSGMIAVSADLWMQGALLGQDERAVCANATADCSAGCGECYVVTGSQGSAVVLVAGFISGTTSYGEGDTFSLSQSIINQVYVAGEQARGMYGVTYKKVPCPVTGTINAVLTCNNPTWDGLNLDLAFVNHRVGIRSITILPRDANEQTIAALRGARDILNRVQWFPTRNITKTVPCIFGASPSRSFDVDLTSADGSAVIRCVVTIPSGPATIVSPVLVATKTASGGDCQFPDPNVVVQGCDIGFQANPGYEEQVYGVIESGPQVFDCAPGSAGCSTRFEGPFGNEWALHSVSGCTPNPKSNGGGVGACNAGSKTCFDTGVATASGGIRISHPPMIQPSFGPAMSVLDFAVKCMAGCPARLVLSYSDCPSTNIQMFINSTWSTVSTPLTPQFVGACTSGFGIISFQFDIGARFLFDSIRYRCGAAQTTCPQWSTLAATTLRNDGVTTQMRRTKT